MEMDKLERIQLGGITQWIRIRGADASNPVLLLMQQGPGLPIINEARRFEQLLGLEETFTVVYWDQRGTGLSSPPLRKHSNRFEISAPRMVDDTVMMLELLRGRFGGKAFVAGSPSVPHSRRTPQCGARSSLRLWSRPAWTLTCPPPRRALMHSRSRLPAGTTTDAQSSSWRPLARPRTRPRGNSMFGLAGWPTSEA